MVLTLCRMINGEFSDPYSVNLNNSKRRILDDLIPKYFAMGSNISSGESVGVTSIPSFNDTMLLSEFTNFPRMRLSQRNLIESQHTDPYVKLTIQHYVPVNAYVNESIAEAGLFSTETGNSCLFRVTFDRFVKDPLTVIEVLWEITIVSLESSVRANISIDKSSLYSAICQALEKVTVEQPILEELTSQMKIGIDQYVSKDATQEDVDETVEKINEFIRRE